jgi:hypothetical protein
MKVGKHESEVVIGNPHNLQKKINQSQAAALTTHITAHPESKVLEKDLCWTALLTSGGKTQAIVATLFLFIYVLSISLTSLHF